MRWELTGQREPADDGPAPPRRGILMLIAVAMPEAGWRIQAVQNTDIVAGAVVPPRRP